MQNGRNRIAARGRTKAAKGVGKAPRKPKARQPVPAAFPPEVAVATPPGIAVPRSFPAKAPKPRTARRKPPTPTRQRPPGRKKRAATREAEHRRQTALVLVQTTRAAKATTHPATPDVICLPQATIVPEAVALPLPPTPEALVLATVPNSRALARPARSLVAAISAWLGSARRLLAQGLLPRKARKPLPRPPRSLAEVNRIASANAARRQRERV